MKLFCIQYYKIARQSDQINNFTQFYLPQMQRKFCQVHQQPSKLIENQSILPIFSFCFENNETCQKTLFCSQCEHKHRNKLTLESLLTKLQKLAITSQKELKKYLNTVGSAIEKLKYVIQFKKTMQSIQSQILTQFDGLLETTEQILRYQNTNKKFGENLIKQLVKIDDIEQITVFEKQKLKLFSKINLSESENRKTVSIENKQLVKLEKRSSDSLKRIQKKYCQMKDYCIKIIEVVINDDDDFEDETLGIVTKFYQRNRDYIFALKRKQQPLKKISVQIQNDQQTQSARERNRYLNDLEKKGKKMQEKLLTEVEELTEQNKRIKMQNTNLKQVIEKSKKGNWRLEKRGSLSTTANSETQLLFDRMRRNEKKDK